MAGISSEAGDMISGQVAMHGFDSPSFATLCTLVAQRDVAPRREIHLLCDADQVLAAVDTSTGPLSGPFEPVTDSRAAAAKLRAETGADRVIVADRAAVAAMMRDVEAGVTAALTQPEVMLRSQQAFRDAPGIVADPPLPSVESWRELTARLAAAGDGTWLLAASEGDDWPIALQGRLKDGVIVEVTDLLRAARENLPDLNNVVRLLGEPIRVSLVIDMQTLRDVLAADDVAAALLAHLATSTELP